MTVKKRYNKYYYTDFYIQGKRIVRKVDGSITSRRSAQVYEDNLKIKMMKGEIGIRQTDPELSLLISKYLSYSKTNKAPSTYSRDELGLRNFINLTGLKKLSEVTPEALEKFKENRRKDVTKRTVNIEIKILKAMLNKLVELKIIPDNPIKSVKMIPGPSSKTIEFFEKDEVEALLNAASETLYPIFYTYLKTGLRKSELIHLEWSDINFGKKQIKVINKKSHQLKGYRERYIPMDDKLFRMLRKLKKSMTSSYVFTTKIGTIRSNNLIREVKLTARKAGITKNATIHMFRHTYASHLTMEGVPLRTVQELLGHASITTTMRYAHLAPDHLSESTNKLPY